MANPGYVAAACANQGVAGAAVIAVLFALLMLVALGNLCKTQYPLYIVLTVSCLSESPLCLWVLQRPITVRLVCCPSVSKAAVHGYAHKAAMSSTLCPPKDAAASPCPPCSTSLAKQPTIAVPCSARRRQRVQGGLPHNVRSAGWRGRALWRLARRFQCWIRRRHHSSVPHPRRLARPHCAHCGTAHVHLPAWPLAAQGCTPPTISAVRALAPRPHTVLACALTSQSVKGRALTLLATSSAHSGGRLCTADDKVAPRGRRRWVLLTRLLIPAQVCFGPVLGVIASGLLFGSDDALLWRVGDRLLHASIWVRAAGPPRAPLARAVSSHAGRSRRLPLAR